MRSTAKTSPDRSVTRTTSCSVSKKSGILSVKARRRVSRGDGLGWKTTSSVLVTISRRVDFSKWVDLNG